MTTQYVAKGQLVTYAVFLKSTVGVTNMSIHDQPVNHWVSVGRSHLILHWIDKIPKKNIFQSIFQKAHKNYSSIGW